MTLNTLKQEGITAVVVAHRPTIVSTVDTLLVLKSGTIERYGPRDEILQQYTAPKQAIPDAGGDDDDQKAAG